jgi:uncharacterized delta-60 repeat protein
MKTSQKTLVLWSLFGLIAAIVITVFSACKLGGSSPPPTSQAGTLDTSFLATGAGADQAVNSVAVQPSDGKILIGGQFTHYNTTTSVGHVARLNTDGTLDTGFNAGGAGTDNPLLSVAVQPSDGKILIGGYFTSYNGTSRADVARLNTDGTLDTTFPASGGGANGQVNSIAVQSSDGKILVGGGFTAYNGTGRGCLARLNTDGTLDTTLLATGTGATGAVAGEISVIVNSIAVQSSDGKILIGGGFTTYNGTSVGCITRLNTDGTLDTSFNATGAGTGGTYPAAYSVAVQPSDGKILIGGSFTTYNGTSVGCIVRLNTDGTLDTGFNPPSGGTIAVAYSLAVQSDGKILIGGGFTIQTGSTTPVFDMARLNADGSLDTTFLASGGGAGSYVNSIALQSDGKIIIGGNFTAYYGPSGGTSRGYVARLLN